MDIIERNRVSNSSNIFLNGICWSYSNLMQFQIRLSTIYYIFHERLLIQTLIKYPVSAHLSNIWVIYDIKNLIIFNSTFSFHYHIELINIKLIFLGYNITLIFCNCTVFVATFVYDSFILVWIILILIFKYLTYKIRHSYQKIRISRIKICITIE